MKLFVGIDVSSEKLDVCFLTDDNQLSILSEISVANDIEGASFIRETILEFNNSYHFDQIVIGMESTSMYSFHPSMFFHEDEKLKKLNTLICNKFVYVLRCFLFLVIFHECFIHE
ncbi:hypothetical protein EfmJHP36_13830 [Enterococcus faecium]|nr:hypothetical protein EfmJHP36_13830 [Enterococcus faecium]